MAVFLLRCRLLVSVGPPFEPGSPPTDFGGRDPSPALQADGDLGQAIVTGTIELLEGLLADDSYSRFLPHAASSIRVWRAIQTRWRVEFCLQILTLETISPEMKFFKLWVEIEEYDSETGLYRNLTSDGEASPVPVGSFRSLEDAVVFAEQLAEDQTIVQSAFLSYELLN